jgi:hypothetical protein
MKKLGLFVAALTLALPARVSSGPNIASAGKPVKKESHVVCEMVEQTGSILRVRVCRPAEDENSDVENGRHELQTIRDQAERDAVRNVPNSLRPSDPH